MGSKQTITKPRLGRPVARLTVSHLLSPDVRFSTRITMTVDSLHQGGLPLPPAPSWRTGQRFHIGSFTGGGFQFDNRLHEG